MSADMIAGRRFGQSWRGYDTEEVQQFLSQVAAHVRVLRERIDQAEGARREAEQRASHPELDEALLMTAVGEETAAILRSARGAATEITAKAEAKAQSVVAEAEARAAEVVAEAESLLSARSAEAGSVAREIHEQAVAEAEHLRELAQQQADAIAEETAKKCDEAVQGAQAVRERILTDLARRRKLGSVQVEQLRAGRERLLDAYLVVRKTLDKVTDELQRADAEARAAADAVGPQHGLDAEELVELRSDEALPAYHARAEGQGVAAVSAGTGQTASDGPEESARPARAGVTTIVGAGPTSLPPPKILPKPLTQEQAKAGGGAPGPQSPGPALASPVLTRPDAIESVRVLRPEPSGQGPGPSGVTSLPPPKILPKPLTQEQAKAGGGAPGPQSPGPALASPVLAPALASPVLTRPDAIESVRVLRPEPSGQGPGPSGVTLPPAASNGHPDAEPAPSQRDVDGLFARIRADRAEATSNARKSLSVSQPGTDETGADAEAGAEAAAAPASMFFQRREELTARLESSLARKLKRALQDEQNSLLDKLRNLKGPLTPTSVLPSAEEQPDRFVDVGRSLLEEAAQAGARLVVELYGPQEGAQADLGPDVIDDLAEDLGRVITEPLRQRLEQVLQASNEDATEVAEALGPAYREWKTQRIEAAARDQVTGAFSRGAYLAFSSGALLYWTPSSGDAPCPDCEDNALAGAQAKGETWPTGQLHPPAHPGCLCALSPLSPAHGLPGASNGAAPAATAAPESR